MVERLVLDVMAPLSSKEVPVYLSWLKNHTGLIPGLEKTVAASCAKIRHIQGAS